MCVGYGGFKNLVNHKEEDESSIMFVDDFDIPELLFDDDDYSGMPELIAPDDVDEDDYSAYKYDYSGIPELLVDEDDYSGIPELIPKPEMIVYTQNYGE